MERWLLGDGADSASDNHVPSPARPEYPERQDQLIREFMEDLKASSQEWVGRVRLINMESIQDHLGPNWDKLKDRVGILAEKIIQGETSARDRYSRVGDTEFIVFFADATPEESRIRCLGIVEIIHEKLFGSEGSRDLPRIAECHILRGNSLALDWEKARSGVQASGSPPAEVRAIFHEDPEILDAGTIAASSQAVIDAIIARGVESRTPDQLAPLMQGKCARLLVVARGKLFDRVAHIVQGPRAQSLAHGQRIVVGRDELFQHFLHRRKQRHVQVEAECGNKYALAIAQTNRCAFDRSAIGKGIRIILHHVGKGRVAHARMAHFSAGIADLAPG